MENNTGLVSVIIPVYNSEQYLEKALDSVLAQTYERFEVLLIDDGSSDRSPSICDEYAVKDSRIKAIHQENKGPSAARNRGVDEAAGEYITFLDNDDLWHPRFLEILYGLCKENNCDIGLTKSFPFLDEEKIPWGEITEDTTTLMNRKELCIQLMDMGWTGLAVTMAKLFKRSLFDGIRFNENRIISDDDSTIYLLFWASERSILFHRPMYFYRSKRPGSITHSGYKLSWLTGVDAFRERMIFFEIKNDSILYAKSIRNYCRKIAENYVQIVKYFPQEEDLIKNLKKEMQKYSLKMLFMKGNAFRQKISALGYAFCPRIWDKIYKVGGR